MHFQNPLAAEVTRLKLNKTALAAGVAPGFEIAAGWRVIETVLVAVGSGRSQTGQCLSQASSNIGCIGQCSGRPGLRPSQGGLHPGRVGRSQSRDGFD